MILYSKVGLMFLNNYLFTGDTNNKSVPSAFPESLNIEELIKNGENMNEAMFLSLYHKTQLIDFFGQTGNQNALLWMQIRYPI